jgi:arylsulfatase
MQAIFDKEAVKYNVLPLNNDAFARATAPRPSATAGRTTFTYDGVMPGVPLANAPNILGRSYQITADVDVPEHGDGMLATAGGRWGGYALYMLKGKPVFHYNMLTLAQYHWQGDKALTPGKHTIVFDFKYDGPGPAKGGTGVLKVDGETVATEKTANSISFLQVLDETFDVGVDTRTGVNNKDYEVPFAFNGKISKLTVHLEPSQLSAVDKKTAGKAVATAKD